MSVAQGPAGPRDNPWQVASATALIYAAVGWLSLAVAVPPSYASPLFPSAGIALAAVLVYGRPGLVGTALGAFFVNVVLGAARGQVSAVAVALSSVIAVGATAQAVAGAALIRRYVAQPLVLGSPREIAGAGLLGGPLACLVSASVATMGLWAAGTLAPAQLAVAWGTWWVGDALGTLIAAPVALSFIGRPRADWAPRRRTVALPLLLATLLLAAGTLAVSRREDERLERTFAHDADRLRAEALERLTQPLHALEALRGAWQARDGLDAAGVQRAAAWWLAQPFDLQAAGVALRVPRAERAAFEAAARSAGPPDFRVFEREDAAAAASDPDMVVIRYIEPAAANAGAVGVNVLSVPAARPALLRARDSGQPAATAAFPLTQLRDRQAGIVVYQALYEGAPATAAARTAAFRGAVFVTVRAERLLAGLTSEAQPYLRWCLVDRAPAPTRLAGPQGCENDEPGASGGFERRDAFPFAGRTLELRVAASVRAMPQQADAWLFSVSGLAGAAMLGALLLTVTGRERRISVAVAERTTELRREIQERSHAELALRESEARLRSILDNVPIGVMFIDTAGRIVETNPRLCEMLDRPALLLLRSTLADVSHPDEHAENGRQIADLLEGRVEISRRQMRLLRADGQVLWVRAHLTVLREGAGPPTRLAGVVEDITEHLRLEESEQALVRAEAASRAKSEFVSRMSHELRTPLNAMIGFAQLLGLDRSPALAPHQRDWTAQIQRAGWHLLDMINDTLDLARIESGAVQLALRPVDLESAVAASTALVANAAGQRRVAIRAELAPAARAVLADDTRLKQVLTNLLSNAVKYNREGGRVTVSAQPAEDGSLVQIAVRDTGLGMTPEQLAALFQPYNRLGRESGPVEGTGIGLVISRRLAELMGGTLDVASRAGEGSVFTLRLPRAESAGAAPAPDRASAPAPYRRRLVHYVEDNETNIEVMRGILLQRPQVELDVSMQGLDGLAAIRHRRPDLILLDMQLPDISGLELLRHIKQDDDIAGIPVIVVSADATTTRMQEALTLGAAHYLTKPVDIPAFLETVDELLNAAETRWG